MPKIVFNYSFMADEYPLTRDKIVIGRMPVNDITIPDYFIFSKIAREEQKDYLKILGHVSRIHAKIEKNGENWYVSDIGTKGGGSNYGTHVNGRRLQPNEASILENDDIISFGPVECKFLET